MKKSIKLIIGATVVICIIACSLVYTRPRSLVQRYPYLDFLQCSEIKGYCFTAPGEEDKQFVIKSTDSDFNGLVDLIQSSKFRTRLDNILPQGTKTHTYTDGDYKWDVILCFDNVNFPDGCTVSGDFLDINNFFGNLSFTFNGETIQCSIDEQDQWTKDIMDIISQYTIE